MSSFRLGLVQLAVGANKVANLARVTEKVAEASKNGAQVVSLPECFNSPYGTKFFPEYAEPVPDGQSCQVLSQAAKTNKVKSYTVKTLQTFQIWCILCQTQKFQSICKTK